MRHNVCVCVCMCICVNVPVCYCVHRETLINIPYLGKWWSKRAPAVNTGSAAQIEMEENEDLCDCFHPDGGYNGVGVGPGRFPRWQTIERSVELLKYCCLTTAAPRLHQLTAAMRRRHDAEKNTESNIKGHRATWQCSLFLEARRVISGDLEGVPPPRHSTPRFLWNLKYLCTSCSHCLVLKEEFPQRIILLTMLYFWIFSSMHYLTGILNGTSE